MNFHFKGQDGIEKYVLTMYVWVSINVCVWY